MTIMYRYIKLAALAAAMMVQACDARLDETALVELGLEENEYVVEAEAGSIEFAVYSNGPYHIEGLDDENTWLTLSQTEGSGDATIKASLTKNENFRRMAKLVFCSEIDERKDTIVIKQAGMKEPVLKLLNNSIVIPGKGGTHEEDIVTNIPSADMEITKIYDIKFEYLGRFTVELGTADDIERKFKFVSAIIDALGDNEMGVIDVSSGETGYFNQASN